MNQELRDLEVDNYNLWARYDNWGRRPVRRDYGGHRDGPVAKVVALVFWGAIAIWLLSAIVTIL